MKNKNWENRFEKFWVIITDPKSSFEGRPAYNGCSYMSVGNAVMDFIRTEIKKAEVKGYDRGRKYSKKHPIEFNQSVITEL